MACLICDRVALAKRGENPYFIAEMEHTIFVVGDHQFYAGYSLVLCKEHVREPYQLPPDVQREHFSEVMRAAQAVEATFQPSKMNFSCYGNSDPHVHWHIVPRYDSDPTHGPPWSEAAQFGEHMVSADEATEIAARIRANFD